MLAYIKSRADFKTVMSAEAISWEAPLCSIEDDVGTIILCGTDVTHGNEGDFLIMGGHIWLIDQVSPEEQQTTVAVADVRCAFDRPLPYSDAGTQIGAWLSDRLDAHYKSVSDAAYRMPYLQIVNTDVTEFLPPTVTDGLYNLKTYMDERVQDVFSQNSCSHKIEWRSDVTYDLYDTTSIRLDGGRLSSYVSYVGISSADSRFLYKSGELATTLTERLKGAKL